MMSRLGKAVAGLLLLLVVGFFIARWLAQRASPPPQNLGLSAMDSGSMRLAPCPASPNCVSTRDTDAQHGMEPIPFDGDVQEAQARLRAIVSALPRATLVAESPGYLHAAFRSALWGFVDDVEFQLDAEAQVIHFRSASRLGYSDVGVNRARMEQIRDAYLSR